MTRIIEPLTPEAEGPHPRILEKLAYALSDEIKRKKRFKSTLGESLK